MVQQSDRDKRPRLPGSPSAGQVEGDVDEHVLLSADQAAASGFDQERTRIDIKPFGDRLGMTQKARVHAGVAQRQGFSVDAHRTLLQEPHQVVGGVFEGVEVAAVLPAHPGGCRGEVPQVEISLSGSRL
jgi:hypothetical protein